MLSVVLLLSFTDRDVIQQSLSLASSLAHRWLHRQLISQMYVVMCLLWLSVVDQDHQLLISVLISVLIISH